MITATMRASERNALLDLVSEVFNDPDARVRSDKVLERLSAAAEALKNPVEPQVYVYLSDGGILDSVVTRGEVDIVSVDWDENMDRSIEDWREVRAELSRIARPALRDQEIAWVDEEIERLRLYAEADAEADRQRQQAILEAARSTLREAGEL